jgi:DNA repair protein RecO (recombination protein O)
VRATLESGYVLHTRAWRDNSLLVEFFSRDQGRVSLVARGAKSRKTRGGSVAALLQPFTPLQCSWSGRTQLRNLTACEAMAPSLVLGGRRLFSGLYMNELLVRLLHHDDPHNRLFDYYAAALEVLSGGGEGEEEALRRFELVLLEELGYGFDLHCDGISGESISGDSWYYFHEEHGLVELPGEAADNRPRYRGSDLQSISRGDFTGTARQCAKRLLREALASHLGGRPLKSRDLFKRPD